MARICVIHMLKEEISQAFIANSKKVLEKVRRPDTEITIKPVRRGPSVHSQHANLYGLYLTAGEIIERVLEADREGYDAVVLNGTLDKYLGIPQARSLVSIPVVSPSEAAMLYACMLGRRFGIIALGASYLRPLTENLILQHGLHDRAIYNPVRFISIDHKELMTKAMGNPLLAIPELLQTARECVRDGAEVIIPIGTNLGILCTLAGVASFDVDGREVPVLDPLAIALKTAETMVELRAKIGLPAVSRAGMHHLVTEEDLGGLRAEFGLKTD